MKRLAVLSAATALLLAIIAFSTNSPGAEPEPALNTIGVATFRTVCTRTRKPRKPTREVCRSRTLGNVSVRLVGGPPGYRVKKRAGTGPDGLTGFTVRAGTYSVLPGAARGRELLLGPTRRFVELTDQEVEADVIFEYSPPRPESLPSQRSASAP